MESASKVKVEYTDPSNIFTTFASELNPRLPLRELHWSSSSRPTRSIGSLHLELVSDENSKSSAAPSSTESSIGNQDNGVPPNSEGPKKERRHQIPGLLRTPYLKVYLISCNDIETYKGSYRKQLREWVKENTPQSQSSAALNKQDNHDAFEWLIIHVVSSSGTGSSNTSRPASIKGDGPAEKRPNSSRWSSRNSTSVVEKLRSDFNGMSKTAIGRVAQVQLVEPSSDGTPQVDRRAQDSPNGWDDLIFKTKSLILSSFDLRVSQYEDDIREREGQKKVFGWNFNTFFVLKEGLAMGFESMGLLEDALTVYRELSFGLRSAIEEQQIEGAEQQTAHFVDYTQDLYESFEHAGTAGIQTSFEDSSIRKRLLDPGASLLDTNRKPFRDLILSNKISVYDFQCYIFARQSVLSLRLANKDIKQRRVERRNGPGDDDEYLSDNADLSKPSDHEPENLLILAEIVKSTIGFITATARIVREDIECAITQSEPSQKGIGESKSRVYGEKTEDFVMSWLFSASQCVLEATSARSLTAQLSPLLRQVKPGPDSPEARADGQQDANNVEVGQHKDLPTRTSSLPSKNPARPLSPPNGQFLSLNSLDAAKLLPPGNPHPGSQTLAAERGELIALLRRVLSSLAIRHGCWEGGLADITFNPRWHEEELGIIELNDNLEPEKSANTSPLIHAKDSSAAGLCNADLLSAVISSTDFYSLHETLTISALVHYVVGNRGKAAEAMTADLAVARFRLKDYSGAASYFRQLAPFYANTYWSDLEVSMLDAYAQSLKHLKSEDEYVRIILKILAKLIRDHAVVERQPPDSSTRLLNFHYDLNVTGNYLSSILATSESFNVEQSAPLNDYFDSIQLAKHIYHSSDHDGFGLYLSLRSLLPEEFPAQSVRIKIVSTGSGQRSELWLNADDTQLIRPGRTRIALVSKVLQLGWFILDQICIKSSNIVFTLNLSPEKQVPLFPRNRDSTSSANGNEHTDHQSLLVWPRTGSLEARVSHYEAINLEQPSSIKVELSTGQNNVIDCRVFLRAASAGLRLHTAEAKLIDGDIKLMDVSQSGSISISSLPPDTKADIIIPYSIETDLREISVRIMIEYTTSDGEFAYTCNPNLPIFLPLAINVQDVFKQAVLVSKFTIGTSSSVPVRISNCRLEGTPDFRVEMPPRKGDDFDVFVRQPLSLISKIYQNSRQFNGSTVARNKLFLKLEYRCLDTIVHAAVQKRFLSALEATTHQKFSRVLGPTLLTALRSRVGAQDLEAICLLREVDMGTFDEWGWDLLLAGIPSEDSQGLERWLRSWHEENRKIRLEDDTAESAMQYLTVPVEIPQMQVVHSARLRRLLTSSAPPQLDSVPMGKGIPMELTISHTRKWGNLNLKETASQALEFCFEIHANPDIWVVGGQRRAHFSAMEDEIARFALLLWPQKPGNLALPSLEIHSITSTQNQDGDQGTPAEPVLSCELDYQNIGETILVVPGLKSTTVSLDPNGTGGGWLVESKSRSP